MQHTSVNNPARYRFYKLGMGNTPEGKSYTLPTTVTSQIQ